MSRIAQENILDHIAENKNRVVFKNSTIKAIDYQTNNKLMDTDRLNVILSAHYSLKKNWDLSFEKFKKIKNKNYIFDDINMDI